MRHPAFLTALLLTGCGVDCELPAQARGTYAVFANVIEHDGMNLDNYPAATSPNNGWSEWEITGDDATGAMTILIDGQPFNVGYTWSNVECGTFTATFGGRYVDSDDLHDFDVIADFAVFANRLEGSWTWSEDWTAASGESGTFDATGNVSGTRVE